MANMTSALENGSVELNTTMSGLANDTINDTFIPSLENSTLSLELNETQLYNTTEQQLKLNVAINETVIAKERESRAYEGDFTSTFFNSSSTNSSSEIETYNPP